MSERTKTAAAKKFRPVGEWRLEVVAGPSKGLVCELAEGVVRIGSARGNDVVIDDAKVSRHHLVLEVRATGLRARDLGSKNGTYYQRSRIEVADLPATGAVLVIGESELALVPADTTDASAPSQRTHCGRLIGQSAPMRRLFTQIERIAPTTATVLIHGETGAGKELVAEALHELSERRGKPFVVVDCGAIPRDLIESELFGHVRGAFTGAASDRRGAFELAHGGTIFLDEIGELEPSLQPRLLRVLETGEIKPIGGERSVRVDVRVIAATLRDLAAEVQAKRFRDDLFYRLSVVRLEVPPLRARLDDVPLLVDHFLADMDAMPLAADSLHALSSFAWPGNVRQLRNVLERAVALAQGGVPTISMADLDAAAMPDAPSPELLARPYKEAKDELVARFTKDYLEALLARNGGNVSAAAREAQVDRNWIMALARRHGVRLRD